ALGRVYLVSGDGDEVRAEALRREGQLHEALDGVAVEERLGARLFERAGDPGDVRDGAGLVVDEHERDELRLRPERVQDGGNGDGPGLVRGEPRDLPAAALELVEGAADGVVLGLGAYDVAALGGGGARPGEDGPVVRLGAAGGENDLPRPAAQAERKLAP